MKPDERKQHWEKIYSTKNANEVSWYQAVPQTALHLIEEIQLPRTASIIDIGAGDSRLPDHLLQKGFTHITLLDISENAINKSKARLGEKASCIQWIVADVLQADLPATYDCWYDRAAFHFFTSAADIEAYRQKAAAAIKPGGYLIIGGFSEDGPAKCSGIPVTQYAETGLTSLFEPWFEKQSCFHVDHATPFGGLQNFIFCTFKRKRS